ncbi:MAG TPA: CHAT domain-containing protein [Alloacidobacterium sp.]|nr:CHAT domain-containing protein [Alloacidobacterium sp.]
MQGNLSGAQKNLQAFQQFPSTHTQLWDWKFRLLEANLKLLQGLNAEALSLLSNNLPSNSADPEIAIQKATIRAIAYARLGQASLADQELQEAQKISAAHHALLAAELFRTRGVVAIEQNDLSRAGEMFHQSLDIARQQKDRHMQASALLNLGVIALQQEHFDEAFEWSKSAADEAQSLGDRLIQEKSQGNIAYADYALGNYEEALDRFREAQREANNLGSPNDEVEWLNNAGLSFYRLGEYQQAEDCYKEALRIAETIQYQEEIIEAHLALGFLYLQLDRLDAATEHDQKALASARISGRKGDTNDALFLQSIILFRQNENTQALKNLHVLEMLTTLLPSQRWQVEGALANVYAAGNQSNAADKWYRQSITTFETQRETIKQEESKLPFSTNANQLYDDYIRFLIGKKRTDEALQWLDLGRARTLEEGLGIAAANFKAATQAKLDAPAIARRLHGTILVYSLGDQASYLWAVTPAGTHFFTLPAQAEINEHVKNYQRAILDSRDTLADSYADGMALYRILVEPAASLIPKNSPVYIVPDGSLSTLNFETLLAPGGGIHYWIEDAIVTNASSLKLLAAFHPETHTKTPKKLLLIGNPISPDEKFPDLLNASSEVADVARHFQSAEETVFTQKQALPSVYTGSDPGQFSYIHFVAHGTSSSASPLDSAIVLTRNPANPDAFKLYARDIIRQPLQADLVTVSACYGSGSRVYGGEGLIGLSWAFLRAGAHYVVGSLWEVSDAATPQLMDGMYNELASGHTPASALRDAKLAMLHSRGVFRKPLYWATFQLYGGT